MGVRQFFRKFFAVKSTDLLRDEVFALAYGTDGGIDYTAIENMLSVDRIGYLRRLQKQLKREADLVKKSSKPKKPIRRR